MGLCLAHQHSIGFQTHPGFGWIIFFSPFHSPLSPIHVQFRKWSETTVLACSVCLNKCRDDSTNYMCMLQTHDDCCTCSPSAINREAWYSFSVLTYITCV